MSQQFSPSADEPILRTRDACGSTMILRMPVSDPSMDAPAHRLMSVLSWKRPFDSAAEEMFARKYIDPLEAEGLNYVKDAFSNRHVYIPYADGAECKVMWSCHIDTCHHDEGYQRLFLKKDRDDIVYIGVRKGEGSCLGADDGTGVWLMLEMIAARRPGYYLFHRGEEKGCLGSRWLKDNKPDLLRKFNAAIALDRRGFDNIITHQGGERGCSESFAAALGAQLGNGYKADPTGAFTDTKQYFAHIPECTNLSVGYDMQHGPLEKQYLNFALALRGRLLTLDTSVLPIVRDPTKSEYRYGQGANTNYRATYYRGWLDDPEAAAHNPVNQTHSKEFWVWSSESRGDILRASATFIKGRGYILTVLLTPEEKKTVAAAANVNVREPESDPGDIEPTKVRLMEIDSALTMLQLIRKYPAAITAYLVDCKFNSFDLLTAIHGEDYIDFSIDQEELAEEEAEEEAERQNNDPLIVAARSLVRDRDDWE